MITPAPKTIGIEINKKLADIYLKAVVLGDTDVFLAKTLFKDCEKLKKVDQIQGMMYEASVLALTGKYQEAKKLAVDTMRADGNGALSVLNFISQFIRTGYLREARHLSTKVLSLNDASYPDLRSAMARTLFDETLASNTLKQLCNSNSEDVSSMSKVKIALEICTSFKEWGVPVDSAVSMIDLAGEVIRSNNYMLPSEPSIIIDKLNKLVWYHFDLPLPFEAIRSLSLDFEERLFLRIPDAPIEHLHVGFVESKLA